MLEKVQARQQRAAFDFESQYEHLCCLADIAPLRTVKAALSEGSLDVNGDHLRSHDWPPLLDAIKTNKSLSTIAIHSYFTKQEEKDEKSPSYYGERIPPLRSRDITYRLSLSLKDCMTGSPTLNVIHLQGIPLRERDLVLLGKGLHDNSTVASLSLEGCVIGDKGVEVICSNIRNLKMLKIINFASCGLSGTGAEVLSELIRHQSIRRHNDAWRDSLRYRRPDLDVQSGIRRITLNGNGLIGDDGVQILAEALKDDLWIKALDMQRCGVTTQGAKVVLEVMKYNTSIVVLDLRRNPMVDSNVLRNVMEHVLINSNGKDQEFQWLSTTDPQALAASGNSGKLTRPDSRLKVDAMIRRTLKG
jgi:centrosomal protein CEP78